MLRLYANPITHRVFNISTLPGGFSWKSYDIGKNFGWGYKAFKVFLIGPNWYEQRKTCWQSASSCLDNKFSDQVNQEPI